MANLTLYSLHPEPNEAVCIGCGCSDTNACIENYPACFWLKVDRQNEQGICSSCPECLAQWNNGLVKTFKQVVFTPPKKDKRGNTT
uniref:Conserved protein n=1 Tax=Vibrio tapetis TaxID=52443 RepID=B2LS64_9VIBR|nr:conserved protein [Vibrio tapetis]